MNTRGSNLDPTEYIEMINTIENARTRMYNDPEIFEGFSGREYSPRALAREYGTTERNVVRALRRGVGHYERALRRRVGKFMPSLEMRPEGITEADYDFLMYEVREWLSDEGSYKDFFTSPVVARRCPAVRHFRSLTQLRTCYRQWREEYRTHGVGLDRNRAMAREYRS